MTVRAAFYVDGFNLYHAINDLSEPFLKWCNLRRLAEIIVPQQSEVVVKIVYCSAFYPGDSQKKWRHQQYINALKLHGVDVILGHYVHQVMECRSCDERWQQPSEKQTDINIALSLFNDARLDYYYKAYLISADTDQASTVRFVKDNFPHKKVVPVVPPGRNPSQHINSFTTERPIKLNRNHIERSVMGESLFEPGAPVIRRPREYAPPAGWVHPDRRPSNSEKS